MNFEDHTTPTPLKKKKKSGIFVASNIQIGQHKKHEQFQELMTHTNVSHNAQKHL